MTAARMSVVVVAGLLAGGAVIALVLTSDHVDTKPVWAVFQPAVGWIFVGTGLYAWRRRPESRIGALLVAMGFAWYVSALEAANAPVVFTASLVLGGLFGAVFLHLGLSFPTGRLPEPLDRRLVIAGYLIFPLAFVPALLFSGPHELRCDDCPDNLLAIEPDMTAAVIGRVIGGLLYGALFVIVLVRAVRRWRASEGLGGAGAAAAHACVRDGARRVPALHGLPGHRRAGRRAGGVPRGGAPAVRVPG